jgi:hypothetical protein
MMNAKAKDTQRASQPRAALRTSGAVMNETQTSPLTVRLLGRDVELTCAFGFTLAQPLRAPIEDWTARRTAISASASASIAPAISPSPS